MSYTILESAWIEGVNYLQKQIHEANVEKGFWGEPRTVAHCIALIHSELSEALEADRKDLMDDHLPQYKGLIVELADAVIRILDLAGHLNLPLGQAIIDKLAYNKSRPYKHGKVY
jgi:NTP pyrophosphatase (non-canonical NTP hydrolase)